MAQSVSVSVTAKNGNLYPSAKNTGFPTQGILIEAISYPASSPLYGNVTMITLLSTGAQYLTATATATVITAANA